MPWRYRASGSKIGLDVDVKGPLFDGSAPGVLLAFVDKAKAKVAQEGVNMVHVRLAGSLKHPTGHYQSRITVKGGKHNDQTVTDGGIIYGPWLEGTSRRNQSTRFKGYKTFRKTRLELRRKVGPIIQDDLRKAVGELGGSQ